MPRAKPPPQHYDTPADVPDWVVRRDRAMKGVINILDRKYGAGNWGDDEVRLRAVESNHNKARDREREEIKVVVRDTAAARFEKFRKQFDDATHNDEQQMRQMVDIEMQVEAISFRIRTEQLADDSLKELTQLQLKLSQEYRQIEKSLGIDRASRDTAIDTAAEIKRFTEGARKLLKERTIQILCQKCMAAGRKINQGYILYHFKFQAPFRWWSKCPHPECGADIVIQVEADPQLDWRVLVGANGKEPEHVIEP